MQSVKLQAESKLYAHARTAAKASGPTTLFTCHRPHAAIAAAAAAGNGPYLDATLKDSSSSISIGINMHINISVCLRRPPDKRQTCEIYALVYSLG